MTKLQRGVSHMMKQVWLGRLVAITSMVAACVSEPVGIQRTNALNEPDSQPTAGQPSDVITPGETCRALELVRAKCARCHDSPPHHGAPFSLTSLDDLLAVDNKGIARRERMAEAVERGDMPPSFIELEPPVELLGEEERDRLLTWLRSDEASIAHCE